jgi:HK97 family phage major capsid protein
MTPEEVDQFDKIMAEADEIEGQIEREQKAMKMDSFLNDPADSHTHSKGAVDVEKASINSLQFKAFNGFLKEGFGSDEYKTASAELKTLQADLDTSGGYLTAPQQFMTQLLKNVDDFVVMRRLGRVIPIGRAESLGVPTLDTDMNDADWTTELATGNQDDATRFGKRELRPHPFAKRVKVSNTLLRVSLLDPEAHVRERMAYKFGLTQEKGYLTGDGQSKPLGVFTADPNGVPTSRDVVCGSTTAITADGIIDVKHTLKPQYWAAANWLFHRDAVRNIRKLKDGNGQYLWQPGLQANIPNTILDSPYVMSEFAPNTFTTGQYVGRVR